MLANALFSIIRAMIVAVTLTAVGVLVAYVLQGDQMARDFLKSAAYHFDGLLVFAAGYGLLGYVRSTGRSLLSQLIQVVELQPDDQPMLLHLERRAVAWRWTNAIALPLTAVGAVALWNCGYPLDGFARFYLALWTTSIYYVASAILAFYIFVIALFKFIEERSESAVLQRAALSRKVQVMDSFFVISATMGVVAIYLGFRGTLTANFVYPSAVVRDLLVMPIVLYLPATLFYSLYPRHVLRHLVALDAVRMTEDLEHWMLERPPADLKDELELRRLVMEIRERTLAERQAMPLLSLKDAPSLTISILIFIQFVLQRDSVVAGFFDGLFHRGTP